MRRKTDTDVLKENSFIIIASLLFLIFGLILPFTSSIEYDQLYKKEITIESIKLVHIYKGGYRYKITTTDGESFIITGDYNAAEVEDSLRSATKASIKYYKHRILSLSYVEEIIVGEKYIVQYNDKDIRTRFFSGHLTGAIIVLLGALGFLYVKWRVKINRDLQNKRDQRIIKKYGSIKNNIKR